LNFDQNTLVFDVFDKISNSQSHPFPPWIPCPPLQDLNAKDLVSGIARLKGAAPNIDMALFRKAAGMVGW
jgi:hypothetical protein